MTNYQERDRVRDQRSRQPNRKETTMPNTVTINISSPQGSHKVVMQQELDPSTGSPSRTINSSLDGKPHAITECSANSDGTALKGTAAIFWFHDVVSVEVDPASNAVTMDVSGAGIDYSGILGPGESAALVAFVKAAKLPDLAA
jgi:hypothetical protein